MIDPAKSGGHDVAADAQKLRALHVPGQPLLLADASALREYVALRRFDDESLWA